MKYPEKQFNQLVNTLQELNKHFENLKDVNVHSLHFLAYQQYNEGQDHNSFVITKDNAVIKKHFAESLKNVEYERLFNIDNDFELYPAGCNDNHIETAVKRALKQI